MKHPPYKSNTPLCGSPSRPPRFCGKTELTMGIAQLFREGAKGGQGGR